MTKVRVQIVEDEPDIADLIQFHMEREGYQVRIATTGRVGLEAIQSDPPDLVILDLMLPDVDGLEICRRLKWSEETRNLPILIVSAKGEDSDVVSGLELGADDYVTKPFNPRVLMARVRNVLRRARHTTAEQTESRRLSLGGGEIVIDLDRHTVQAGEQPVDLTATEFGILRCLAQRPGFVRTRDQIIAAVHGETSRAHEPNGRRSPHRDSAEARRSWRADPDGPRRRLPAQRIRRDRGMTRRRSRHVLRRYGVVLVLIQAFATMALSMYAGARTGDLLETNTEGMLDRLALVYSVTVGADDPTALAERLSRDAERTGVRITLVAGDGTVTADSHADPAEMDNHKYRPEIDEARQSLHGMAIRASGTVGEELMYVARQIDGDNDDGAIVRMAYPMAPIHAQARSTAAYVLIAGSLLIVLSVIVLSASARALHRGVIDLSRAASQFAAGNLARPLELPAEEELHELVLTMNEMASTLRSQMARLQAQQQDLRGILRAMNSGVVAVDLEQRVLNVNRAAEEILDIRADAARGRLLQEVVRQPDLNRFVAEAMSDHVRRQDEIVIRGRERLDVQIASATLAGSDGGPAGLLLMLNDVTQLRRLESLRSDFAANVSHELRTPITNVKGYVDTLQDIGFEDQEQAQRFLDIIHKNTDRLAAIVEDMMELTRLEQPRAAETSEREVCEAAPFVREILGEFETVAAARGIALSADVPEGFQICVYRRLLERAVVNLIANAIRYSPDGTAVSVTVERHEDRMRIIVADQGPGIPAEHLPRLFERFFRVDKARSRELGGTGLGLAIVKHVALVHGGQVDVESQVGRGSRFWLDLPVDVPMNGPGPEITSALGSSAQPAGAVES